MPWPVHPTGFFGARGDQDTYRIERSLRFNSADSAYLDRTPASAGNRKIWTWSAWVKRGVISSSNNVGYTLFNSYSANNDNSYFTAYFYNDNIRITGFTTGWRITTQVFRDPSAWYHIVITIDTTQATANNRIRLYVNGAEVTAFSTTNNPSQNADLAINQAALTYIGADVYIGPTQYFDGYLTEINFIDGQALTPSSFGETDAITGRWKAKAYSGTYGTNGFYLKFADNSGTTSTTLGKDSSGNGNNWTPNNFSVTAGAGNDSLVDSPTNYGTDTGVGGEVRGNYATLNPISNLSGTYSNGNLDFITATSDSTLIANIAMNSGKWYCETIKTSGTAIPIVGICSSFAKNGFAPTNTNQHPSVVYLGNSGNKVINGTSTSYGSTYTTNDVIGIAFDADTREIVFYKNGISQGIITGVPSGEVVFCVGDGDSVNTYSGNVNFGQRPFAYTAPTGFKALCTTNLPQPTIQKPSKYMDVVTYTGTGSALTPTSSLGFSPDLVWLKGRSGATDHALYDSVRGAEKRLESNNTDAEVTSDSGVTAFNSNGFTLGTLAQVNTNTATYVAWAWDEAPIAGMDIVSYTGNGTNRAIAHNLGVAPKMMIVKNRLYAGAWRVYHQSIGNTKNLRLNLTNAEAVDSTIWNNTSPTSSDFAIGTDADVNRNNDTHIAYLFAEIEGFSKFGSYTGNGSADGPFVWCGFRPRWVMVKSSTAINSWTIYDTVRDASNVGVSVLYANTTSAEPGAATALDIDILSNGFKWREGGGQGNDSGATYIFAAFAESPFKYARAR